MGHQRHALAPHEVQNGEVRAVADLVDASGHRLAEGVQQRGRVRDGALDQLGGTVLCVGSAFTAAAQSSMKRSIRQTFGHPFRPEAGNVGTNVSQIA